MEGGRAEQARTAEVEKGEEDAKVGVLGEAGGARILANERQQRRENRENVLLARRWDTARAGGMDWRKGPNANK